MNPYLIPLASLSLAPLLLAGWVSTAEANSLPLRLPTAVTSIPDRCAELDRYGDPARCLAVGPDMAPWWDGEVCCDDERCVEPTSTGCVRGTSRFWCESAILYQDGHLDCVYEVPSYCEVFPCRVAVELTMPPLEHAVCCHDTGCYDHEGGLCGGTEVWCGKGVTNDDGTITCFDDNV